MVKNTSHPQCKLCSLNVGYEAGLSERQAAEKWSVHRRSVSRHRKHLLTDSPDETVTLQPLTGVVAPLSPSQEFLAKYGIPEDSVRTQHISAKDEKGNWHKAVWNPNLSEDSGIDHELILNEIRESLRDYSKKKESFSPSTLGKTFLIFAADVQFGKTGQLGGSKETSERVSRIYSDIADHLAERKDEFIETVFADMGDVTEGFNNTKQQAFTNDLPLTYQILGATNVLLEGIKRFSPFSPLFTYVSVSSNHCGVRSGIGSKNQIAFPGDDYGLMISQYIEQILSDRDEFGNVCFVRTPEWEESVTHLTADGTTVGFTHGHLAGSQSKLGSWFAGQSHGRRSSLHEADCLFAGHFHNFSVEQTGDGRPVVVCPSVDVGSDWFTNTSGKSYPPSMLTCVVHDGKIEEWRIWS